jgi:radical SAM superfamily enzyme YgiQ (UPF0313 family)
MKVTLISPYFDVASIGLRIVSACLKQAGHHPQMVFLPQLEGGYQDDFLFKEKEKSVKDLLEVCSDSDLIGFTLMTNYYFRVAHLTKKLKRNLLQPIVWGGVHPTIRPQECLEYADMVVVSEGEHSFVELCDTMEKQGDVSDVRGIWYRKNGEFMHTGIRSLIHDLDSIPFPDYSLNDAFILENDSIVPMDSTRLQKSLLRGMTIDDGKPAYQIITSRGCPLNCSYCCNDVFRQIHGSGKFLRNRTPKNIIDELEYALKAMDFFEGIWISDDCFLHRTYDELETFIEFYKKKINLPFFCLADPLHVTEEKMKLLCDGGLKRMTMGIQSGSDKTKKLYKRSISNERILETSRIINQYQSQMHPPMYDIIVDNPYENLDDMYATIKLIAKLPRPYYLQLFSLTFFPGSSLYHRAMKDGIITDQFQQVYNKPYYERFQCYHNVLLRLYNKNIPKLFLKIFSSRAVYFFLSKDIFNVFFQVGYRLWKFIRKILMSI